MRTIRNIVLRNGWPVLIRRLVAFPALLVLVVAAVSCDYTIETVVTDHGEHATSNDELIGVHTTREPVSNVKSAKSKSLEFVGQELEQLDSPFTKETVLALNAIVSRSLAVIEEFDEARKAPETENDANVSRQRTYLALSERAKRAKFDMDLASKRLQSSGEKHNEAIFAAMVRFVADVENEVREEIEELRPMN